MRGLILSTVLTVLLTGQATAGVLTSGTLSDYINLGSAGGSIGSTLFSDFLILPAQNGATALLPSNVFVNPINVMNNPGLQFVVNQTANLNELFELRLSYRVADFSITGASVALEGSSVNVNGANTGSFLLNEPLQTLIAFDVGLISELSMSTTFGSLPLVNVEFDLVIDGGTDGRAVLVSAVNQFVANGSTIPEPSSMSIVSSLFGFLAFYRNRSRNMSR